ncbi:MAG TPA: DegT/DnrJ/EryC1/StrS family aminotransferase [Pirellulales bacterium]|jgi:dTDP-4-amino-4,6-dideoxygalactose transaminase|nr:DegT/DnrJ/EryC1/StrS family aminotransferase [Pirellulales bacterium]
MSIAPREHLAPTLAIPPLSARSSGVPLLDIGRQNQSIRREVAAAVERVCDSGRFVLGPDCDKLEEAMARYCHVPHAVGCASGSDALLLALMALGVGPGDEVLMPSYTFFATASAAWRLGAKPVFVDIEPTTFNLNPRLLDSLITPATKAIIPVHLFGQCSDLRAIESIVGPQGISIVEDAAQAVGAELDGRRAGSWGAIGCLSFYPTKNLGGFGDGGMLTTGDPEVADRLRLLRGHGMEPRYHHQVVGINSRLDSLQAAVLAVKLPHLESWTAARQANARRYSELFASCGLDRVIGLPLVAPGCRHVWNQYVIRVPAGTRDALRAHLAEQKIGTEIYYPVPVHLQQCFQSLGYGPGSLPESERAAKETIALPIFAELSAAEQQTVVRAIHAYFFAPRRAS